MDEGGGRYQSDCHTAARVLTNARQRECSRVAFYRPRVRGSVMADAAQGVGRRMKGVVTESPPRALQCAVGSPCRHQRATTAGTWDTPSKQAGHPRWHHWCMRGPLGPPCAVGLGPGLLHPGKLIQWLRHPFSSFPAWVRSRRAEKSAVVAFCSLFLFFPPLCHSGDATTRGTLL